VAGDWLERWQEGRIGWHEHGGNKSLRAHWNAANRRVLVPLCGKSRDLIWLEQQGNEVVGVELSDLAVEAFFAENAIDYDVVEGDLRGFVARDRSITIYCGDYFKFAGTGFSGCYDRGALVAIAPPIREAYVRHTRSLLSRNAQSLVVTVEYNQALASGPPYSVPESAMLDLWPELERVDAYDDMDNCPPKFRQAGITEIVEAVWRSR